MRWRRTKTIVVPVALGTGQAGAVRLALDHASDETVAYQVVGEAVTTDGLYQLLGQAKLAVVDLDQLQEGTVGRAALGQALELVPHATSAAFLADPTALLLAGRAAVGAAAYPPRVVACTRQAGGVGTTSVALSMAQAFRQATRLPTAVVEMAYGPSPLRTLLSGDDWPDLYDLVTHTDMQPGHWEGVTIYPMTGKYAANLLPVQLATYLRQVQAAHILTVLDLAPNHPQAGVLTPPGTGAAPYEPLSVDVWLVLSRSGRVDSAVGAGELAARLRAQGRGQVVELINAADTVDRVVGMATTTLPLPRVSATPHPKLGRVALRHIYPGAF